MKTAEEMIRGYFMGHPDKTEYAKGIAKCLREAGLLLEWKYIDVDGLPPTRLWHPEWKKQHRSELVLIKFEHGAPQTGYYSETTDTWYDPRGKAWIYKALAWCELPGEKEEEE